MPNQDDNTTTWALEMMHRCEPRLLVLRELRSMVPALVQCTNNSWFRTINRNANSSYLCLFDGAQLELNFSSMTTPEFGFCFPRRSFVAERERLDVNAMLQQQPATTTTDWAGWKRREPSDSDRLRVNKNGWEILYFVQPPKGEVDITVSELRAELCHTLQIETGRVLFGAGPFQWGPDFEEDGLGLYTTYFDTAIDTGARQMKTVRGAALIDVIEISMQAHST
ncbi:uncharacterized protein Z520_06522 [Fonsecaea multimorphosa CBS 102226]|uniref:Uncharacterized protein n=1 Tax=Fonsecaea multimorphosa CBS 102226 TaxID=1442371 RepID=A0A0D2K3J3_9EURO|nr:uncharacterized protein Z520_06522 [Fonsecaea multimorphosa CBS 102226]KIX97744.1 hypothetical protein Z520_06522 [Fonsecaea multimorphosa CBS 102226]OAL23764.1 hypothetical protein AYO22_06083 [Fonsecaea multimorphosa]